MFPNIRNNTLNVLINDSERVSEKDFFKGFGGDVSILICLGLMMNASIKLDR